MNAAATGPLRDHFRETGMGPCQGIAPCVDPPVLSPSNQAALLYRFIFFRRLFPSFGPSNSKPLLPKQKGFLFGYVYLNFWNYVCFAFLFNKLCGINKY